MKSRATNRLGGGSHEASRERLAWREEEEYNGNKPVYDMCSSSDGGIDEDGKE